MSADIFLANPSINSLKEYYCSEEISVTSVTEALINRIERVNPLLNCFINFDHQAPLETARELDSLPLDAKRNLPLFGMPITIKDNIVVKDGLTTAGSKMLANFHSPYDATVVKKLKAAGALIIGKVNLDEFAMGASSETSYFGPSRNPWDTERVPGGSSGGSCASVAAGLAVGSLGTDTGGSVRQPASFCNVVGLKPTYGRISRYGVIAYASSLDQVGVIARSVKDVEIIYQIISGHDPLDSTSVENIPAQKSLNYGGELPLKNLRIGLPVEYFGAGANSNGIDNQVQKIVFNAIEGLKSLGASLVDVSLPHTRFAVPTYYILAPAEASSNLGRYDGIKYGHRTNSCMDLDGLYCQSRTEGFGKEVRRRIVIGSYVLSAGYYDAYYRRALKVRRLIQDDYIKAFSEQCDLILSPASPTPPFKVGEQINDPLTMYLSDIFTAPVNLAGLPALALPAGFSYSQDNKKLPVGIQLIGPMWQEDLLLAVGKHFQEATNWHKELPLFNNLNSG
jgi:aspartyl-tRNA(Asn)/glutamyl-tRNA(Gln) amidotransferase subunit A